MSGNPRSLSYQASCIREQLHKEPDPAKRAGLEGAIDTLEKMLHARDPVRAVLAIYDVFPDARVSDVRFYDEAAE